MSYYKQTCTVLVLMWAWVTGASLLAIVQAGPLVLDRSVVWGVVVILMWLVIVVFGSYQVLKFAKACDGDVAKLKNQ